MDTSAAAASPILRVAGLSKAYRVGFLATGRRPALVDLSFELMPGEVFGYLGPNGSGKTTTIKILMGLVRADAGSASVLGLPLEEPGWRHRVGYLPEHPYFYDWLTPREYLDYAGRLCGVAAPVRQERVRSLLDRVGLARAADVPMRRFSKGMSQRLGIAQALVNEPELVILDEPMSGLDPIGRRMVRDIILELKRNGRTVFFSTHILPDAETLCDRVALLKGGRVHSVGPLAEILDQAVSHVEVLLGGAAPGAFAGVPGVLRSQAIGERCRLEVEEAALVPVLRLAEERRNRILSVSPVRQSLEDYFVRELGQEPADARWEAQD